MGGYGSGRWHYADTRPVAEDGLILSLKPLKEALVYCMAYEGNMWRGWVAWSINGRQISNISYVMTSHDVTLSYTHTRRDGSKLDINERVRLERVPKHFGGHQTYFLCPKCERRSAKLYSTPGSPDFHCRICTGVTYRSCNETRLSPIVMGHDLRPLDAYYKAERRMKAAKTKRARERAGRAYKRALAMFRE